MESEGYHLQQLEAEAEFEWILKQTCFPRSEVSKEQTRRSKLWSIPAILVVFLMFSAVKRFQGYWFFIFFFCPSRVLFAIMNRPAPVEITYENMRFLITHNPTNATLCKFIEVRQADQMPSFFPFLPFPLCAHRFCRIIHTCGSQSCDCVTCYSNQGIFFSLIFLKYVVYILLAAWEENSLITFLPNLALL